MTVQQLIDRLQRNFSPEQQVFIAEFPTSYTRAHALASAQAFSVGRTKDGKCFIGGLGPEACVLFRARK